jgi:hypothetical protein
MRTTIIDRADFVYIADLDPITAPAGHYSLLLSTIWRHARNPEAEHLRLDLVIDREGLIALRGLIDQAVAG